MQLAGQIDKAHRKRSVAEVILVPKAHGAWMKQVAFYSRAHRECVLHWGSVRPLAHGRLCNINKWCAKGFGAAHEGFTQHYVTAMEDAPAPMIALYLRAEGLCCMKAGCALWRMETLCSMDKGCAKGFSRRRGIFILAACKKGALRGRMNLLTAAGRR
ncbi:hypothetical protein KI387_018225, partial [Taxus chinensis]